MSRVEGVEGCSDGGCIWGHPGGMATNGGCKCLYYAVPKLADRHAIEKNVRALRADNARLQKALDHQHAVAGTLLREAERVGRENDELRKVLGRYHG